MLGLCGMPSVSVLLVVNRVWVVVLPHVHLDLYKRIFPECLGSWGIRAVERRHVPGLLCYASQVTTIKPKNAYLWTYEHRDSIHAPAVTL